MVIGVLALQGAFEAHCNCLRAIGVDPCYVRKNADLEKCLGLIIPGGESTAMMHLIEAVGMRAALLDFAQERAIWGTCAGLILLAKVVENASFTPLGLLNIRVKRNAYGRQIASFSTSITIHPDITTPALFIRAPQITEILSKEVEVLATHAGMPVFVSEQNLFATTFHPELTGNLFIHNLFLQKIQEKAYVYV